MFDRLFEKPAASGLESDAFWLGLFLGVLTAFLLTAAITFSLLLIVGASDLVLLLLLGAFVIWYPLARGWIRVLSHLVYRYRMRQGRPPDPKT